MTGPLDFYRDLKTDNIALIKFFSEVCQRNALKQAVMPCRKNIQVVRWIQVDILLLLQIDGRLCETEEFNQINILDFTIKI